MLVNNNRRRGWVIASEDDGRPSRSAAFDARRSVAAWNKGQGPSQASIPSRASSLAPSPQIASIDALLGATHPPAPAPAVPPQPTPRRRTSSGSFSHANQSTEASTSSSTAAATNGKRRPSPPLLEPPKHTYRKSPSAKALPPSAFSDHQRVMAAAGLSGGHSPRPQTSPPPTLEGQQPHALLNRRSQQLSSSSAGSSVSTGASSSASNTRLSTADPATPSTASSVSTPASSVASLPTPTSKGKERERAPAQFGNAVRPAETEETESAIPGDAPALSARRSNRSLLQTVKPMPPVSERSSSPDVGDVPSSPTIDSAFKTRHSEAVTLEAISKRRSDLRIELPHPPAKFKAMHPAIMIDSTHVSDEEEMAESSVPGIARRARKRRSIGSSTRDSIAGQDAEEEEDEDAGADDDSSWPSTPSTTPLEVYFSNADVRRAAASGSRHQQTTKEIIAPTATSLGMGRPMVVVTSPSTASEVSSDRRSSSGSGSNPDTTGSPTPASMAAATSHATSATPSLPKVTEEPPSPSPAREVREAPRSSAPRRSLSFELPPQLPRRHSQETVLAGVSPKVSSKALAFLAKLSPSKSCNRDSMDETTPSRKSSIEYRRHSGEQQQRRSVELKPILLNSSANQSRTSVLGMSMVPPSPNASATQFPAEIQVRTGSGRIKVRPNVVPYHSRRSSDLSLNSSTASLGMPGRMSLERDAFDPHFSPSSQHTSITMPSPALSTEHSAFPKTAGDADKALPKPSHKLSSRPVAGSRSSPAKDRFAASMPSLHETVVRGQERRSSSEPDQRPSLIHQLVDSHKGRTVKDNDSIAEWISVSKSDIPAPDVHHPYGNGGAGEYSNEKNEAGKNAAKRLSRGKPWKLGRFAASEVVLPASKTASSSTAALSPSPITGSGAATATGLASPGLRAAPQAGKRLSSVTRHEPSSSSTAAAETATVTSPVPERWASDSHHIRSSSKTSVQTASAASSHDPVAFTPNLGFTTANRNVVLQDLCMHRSVAALAAGSITVAALGKVRVPSQDEVDEYKTKFKRQSKERKRLAKKGAAKKKGRSKGNDNAAVLEAPIVRSNTGSEEISTSSERPLPSHPSKDKEVPPIPQESEQAQLNLSQGRHSGFNVQGNTTIKSVVPETGNWSMSQRSPSTEEPPLLPRLDSQQPFRDYEDDDTIDLDSELNTDTNTVSESEGEMEWEGQGAGEVPMRLGQRDKEPEMLNVFFSSLRSSTASESKVRTRPSQEHGAGRHELDPPKHASAPLKPFVRPPSLAAVDPGSVVHRGKEIRLCVETGEEKARQVHGPAFPSLVPANHNAESTAIWKAVKVSDLARSTCDDGGYLESKRQKEARQQQQQRQPPAHRTMAMMLESEVSKGAFASFVGNRSPNRLAKRSSVDLCGKERGSPIKPTSGSANSLVDDDDELFIAKEDKASYIVRRCPAPATVAASGAADEGEEVFEIVRRSSTGSYLAPNHLVHDAPLRYSVDEQALHDKRLLPGTPMFDLDKAFPSPFRIGDANSGDAQLALNRRGQRQGSSATNHPSIASEYGDCSRRIPMRVEHRRGNAGFDAFLKAHDGQEWFWRGTQLVDAATDNGSHQKEDGPPGMAGVDLHLYSKQGSHTVELASYSTESQLRNALGLFHPRVDKRMSSKPMPPDELRSTALTAAQVIPLASSAVGGGGGVHHPYGHGHVHGLGHGQVRLEAAPPRRGIRGGPLVRQPSSPGMGAHVGGPLGWKQRGRGLWQNQRAAVSTESMIIQVNNNAVNNSRISLQLDSRDPHQQGRRHGQPRQRINSNPANLPSGVVSGTGGAVTGPAGVVSQRISWDGTAHSPTKGPEMAALTPQFPVKTPAGNRMGELRFTPDCYDRDLAVVSLLGLLGMVKL
ncbi:hypothetical protein BCV70DRAFT_207680 [Testicularia cyperi]|uniref:Uncharacterized protein n=1 Tax=Testicularia cyperi TaxID=1882483 RepID=A0A317XJD0_9BASI|nr:hypothetical protein BCV70DRAFT_207680 [Testicularia cyperi]